MDEIDDEMEPSQYAYPPGLMPSADAEYDSVTHDGTIRVYNVDETADGEWIESDSGLWLFE